MRVAIEAVVSGTPGGVSWGVGADGMPALAIVGSSARCVVLFDSAKEAADFGNMAIYSAVRTMIEGAGVRGNGEEVDGEGIRQASPLVGADGMPIMKGRAL